MLLSLIIPAYNESKRIRKTLEAYVKKTFPGKKEIIVVLNGCTDNSREVVEQAIKELGNEIVLYEIKEGSKGKAVRYGFERAQGDIVGFLDADGATSPEEFDKLVDQIVKHGVDGAIASRWCKGSKVIGRTSVFRTIASQGFYILTKALFWMPFRDSQCGAKLFKKEVIKRILPKLKVENMAFDVEILYLIHSAGFKIREVPTVWVDQASSEQFASMTKLARVSLRMFLTIIALRFKHLFK
ncbi:glycosyltransferase family 2 protein [Patescibacteria group bacterium]|nr:glycosyltransferase family 2 protein [Patescibacteria group bacterium]MBU1890849.1 glycosyltransferase family 2 protein [Patescibacteria group bacterium]